MSKKRRNINALIVLAVIFTGFTMINAFNIAFRMNEYIHHSRSGASSVYVDSTDLLGNHSYKVQITMTDVDDDNAIVQGSVEIFVNNELVTTLTFNDYDWPNGDDEDASASDSEEIWLYPDDDSILQVVIYMDGGDQWSYVLFEDLPIELEQQGFLYAMFSIIGIITILCLILAHLRTFGNTPTVRTFSLRRPSKEEDESESENSEIGVEY